MLRSIYSFCRSVHHKTINKITCPIIVLLYHRVTILDSDPYLLTVTPENFRMQMKFLKDNFPILRFETDWLNVQKPSVVITFDDGYADNFIEALPIIEDIGVPVTFFIATGTIGTKREFWWDDIERLILKSVNPKPYFELENGIYSQRWPTRTDSERKIFFKEMHLLMKKIGFEQREKWLCQLREWANADENGRQSHRAMTQEELCALAKSPFVTIGAHTVTHTCLSSLTPDQQRKEITLSIKNIEEWTHKKVNVFSYPFGNRGDYTKGSIHICRDLGLIKVASTLQGRANRWTDLYQIPRYVIRNWSIDIFAKKISKFWYL